MKCEIYSLCVWKLAKHCCLTLIWMSMMAVQLCSDTFTFVYLVINHADVDKIGKCTICGIEHLTIRFVGSVFIT